MPIAPEGASIYFIWGILLVVVCFAVWGYGFLERRADQVALQKERDIPQSYHLGEFSLRLDERRLELVENGVDLNALQSLIHLGVKVDYESGTDVEILKSIFYDCAYDEFGEGQDENMIMILNNARLNSRAFDNRCAFIQSLLDDHGWRYEGFEVIQMDKKGAH